MKRLLISDECPCFCRELQARGYKIIPTKKIDCFLPPEQHHADLQFLRINSKCFTLDDCREHISGKYPENVRLNCLLFGGVLYGNMSAAASSVRDFCRENDIRTVDVKQGYTRCSALAMNDRAVITAAKGIAEALKKDGAEVLVISPGHIALPGFDYGFIGGAGFCDGKTVFFFGDIKKHPDHKRIREFCEKNQIKTEIICADKPLTDLGGAVIF